MFALPDAKRIRRKDLYDSASVDTSSDEEGARDSQAAESALHARLNAQLSGLLDFSFSLEPPAAGATAQQVQQADQAAAAPNGHQESEGHQEEEAFTFRLFRDEALTHTVILTPDEDPAALGEGAFVVPSRPRSHYIAAAPSTQQASEYRSVAVSAEYVLADARRPRWGLEKPWRVIHISSKSSTPGAAAAVRDVAGQAEKKKRTRPGKKHRILLRVREKAARERAETEKKLALEKEQHIQEKKKRLNRERKLKRRQKEREKKAGAQGAQPDGSSKDADSTANVSDNE
ncbi:hypothetical protein GGS24DRAFT_504837 [Hypoxylon argillaceum]|nr:hypothetical protein GGS24DRAFT_504837 [Hypoxylon argillaceum]